MANTMRFEEKTHTSPSSYDSIGRITLTVIKPGLSKNRRMYPAKVLRASVAIFDGAKMFTEHDPKNGVGQWVGVLDKCWCESDGTVKGTGHIIDALFKKKLELLNQAGQLSQMGVSISCSGTASDGEGGTKIVESLDTCGSVDFVARAAAGGRVEALESEQENRLAAAFAALPGFSTQEALIASRPARSTITQSNDLVADLMQLES